MKFIKIYTIIFIFSLFFPISFGWSSEFVTVKTSSSSNGRSQLSKFNKLATELFYLVDSDQDETLTAVINMALTHPQLEIKTIKELTKDWSDEFLAITLVENRSFSKVQIQIQNSEANANDDVIKRFEDTEGFTKDKIWMVIDSINTKRNLMTLIHELTHVYVQMFLDENAETLSKKYPQLFVKYQKINDKYFMNSSVYAFITELFARYSEYAYFVILERSKKLAGLNLEDSPYLEKGYDFYEFEEAAVDFLVEEYEIPLKVTLDWKNSEIFLDLIHFAKTKKLEN